MYFSSHLATAVALALIRRPGRGDGPNMQAGKQVWRWWSGGGGLAVVPALVLTPEHCARRHPFVGLDIPDDIGMMT